MGFFLSIAIAAFVAYTKQSKTRRRIQKISIFCCVYLLFVQNEIENKEKFVSLCLSLSLCLSPHLSLYVHLFSSSILISTFHILISVLNLHIISRYCTQHMGKQSSSIRELFDCKFKGWMWKKERRCRKKVKQAAMNCPTFSVANIFFVVFILGLTFMLSINRKIW